MNVQKEPLVLKTVNQYLAICHKYGVKPEDEKIANVKDLLNTVGSCLYEHESYKEFHLPKDRALEVFNHPDVQINVRQQISLHNKGKSTGVFNRYPVLISKDDRVWDGTFFFISGNVKFSQRETVATEDDDDENSSSFDRFAVHLMTSQSWPLKDVFLKENEIRTYFDGAATHIRAEYAAGVEQMYKDVELWEEGIQNIIAVTHIPRL